MEKTVITDLMIAVNHSRNVLGLYNVYVCREEKCNAGRFSPVYFVHILMNLQ